MRRRGYSEAEECSRSPAAARLISADRTWSLQAGTVNSFGLSSARPFRATSADGCGAGVDGERRDDISILAQDAAVALNPSH
jgi:hypothetical protein